MTDKKVSALTDGTTANAADRIPIARSPYGSGDNAYITPAYLDTYMASTTKTLTNKTLTAPTLTNPTLGVASATSINKVEITAPATGSTLTIADGKTLTANNSLTLAGTDSTTMTFPSTSATIARTDAANTFTGVQTFGAGSAAAPNLVVGNSTTGVYSVSTTGLAFTVNGSAKLDYGITTGGTWTTTSAMFASGFGNNNFDFTCTAGMVNAKGTVGWGLTNGLSYNSAVILLLRDADGVLGLRGSSSTTAAAMSFYTYGASPPAAPGASMARIYADTSGGKIRLMALFPSGAAQQIAIEP